MTSRANWALIAPLAAVGIGGIVLIALGAHAYGRRQERHAYPKRVTRP